MSLGRLILLAGFVIIFNRFLARGTLSEVWAALKGVIGIIWGETKRLASQ